MTGRRSAFPAGAVLALAVLFPAVSARAAVEARVDYGLGHHAVAGLLTPVAVHLRSREAGPLTVEVTVRVRGPAGEGQRITARGYLSPGARRTFSFLVRPGPAAVPRVELRFDRPAAVTEGGRTLAPARSVDLRGPAVPESRRLDGPGGFLLLAVGPRAGLLPPPPPGLTIAVLPEGRLPETWPAYSAVDAVFWRNPAEEAPVDPARLQALLTWVQMGGRLVVSAVRRPDLLADTLLGEALPAELLPPLPGPANYAELAAALLGRPPPAADRAPPSPGPLAPLRPRDGAVTVTAGSLPVSVEAPYGLGTVAVLGYDPARFAGSRGDLAAAVLLALADGTRPTPEPARRLAELFPAGEDASSALLIPGERDVFLLLRAFLGSGSVVPPPMGLLSFFMVLYILMAGPGDYLLLRRLRLLRFSALTFLGYALLFSALAWLAAFHLFAGEERVNRLTLVDVVEDPGGGPDRVVIRDFTGFYSPRGTDARLGAEGTVAVFSPFGGTGAFPGSPAGFPGDTLEVRAESPARGTAVLSVPFRGRRLARALVFRERDFPLTVEVEPGHSFRVVNRLSCALRDGILVGEGVFLRVGDVPPRREILGVWRTPRLRPDLDLFRHGTPPETLRPDAARLAALVPPGSPPGAALLRRVGRAFQAWSVGSALPGPAAPDGEASLFRARAKDGLDLGRALRHGRLLFLAWTSDAPGLALPAEKASGSRITVIRKVIRP